MPARSTDAHTLDAVAIAALVRWYEAEARDLPWRRTRDPYRILVSEVMLQQTRVETVVGRYESFLRRFPDLATLAAASEEAVLAEWSGLGYYRRARNLHRLAQEVVGGGDDTQLAAARKSHTTLPENLDALRKLPGVGEYTAAAVASIAFDRPHLSIDGNVGRVLCRVLDIRDDPARAVARRRMHAACEPAFRTHPAGTFNQALMELGARICTSRSPRCNLCPLASACIANAEHTQELVPVRPERKVRAVEEGAAVIERRGRILLLRGQRPGALADMWEFPTLDSRIGDRMKSEIVREASPACADSDPDSASPADRVAAALKQHLRQLGIELQQLEHIGEIRHGITDRRIRCHVYRPETARISSDDGTIARAPERRWFAPEEMGQIPLGASASKILRILDAGA